MIGELRLYVLWSVSSLGLRRRPFHPGTGSREQLLLIQIFYTIHFSSRDTSAHQINLNTFLLCWRAVSEMNPTFVKSECTPKRFSISHLVFILSKGATYHKFASVDVSVVTSLTPPLHQQTTCDRNESISKAKLLLNVCTGKYIFAFLLSLRHNYREWPTLYILHTKNLISNYGTETEITFVLATNRAVRKLTV